MENETKVIKIVQQLHVTENNIDLKAYGIKAK